MDITIKISTESVANILRKKPIPEETEYTAQEWIKYLLEQYAQRINEKGHIKKTAADNPVPKL